MQCAWISPHKYVFRNERFLSKWKLSVFNKNIGFHLTLSISYISLFLNNYPARGAHVFLRCNKISLERRLAVTSHLRVTLSLAMSVVKYLRCVRRTFALRYHSRRIRIFILVLVTTRVSRVLLHGRIRWHVRHYGHRCWGSLVQAGDIEKDPLVFGTLPATL